MYFLKLICRNNIKSFNYSKNYFYKFLSTTKGSENNDFVAVYKFPYIRSISVVNKLKLNQMIVTAIVIPGSLGLYSAGIIDTGSAVTASTISISLTLALSFLGWLGSNWVGFIYINNKGDTIRVAYSDFWGKRKDVDIPLNDLVPFSELPSSFTDPLYVMLRRYSANDSFKFSANFGKVMDQNKFEKVFLSK